MLAILYGSLPLSLTEWRILVCGSAPEELPVVDKWIMTNTDENALIIGNGSWDRRFRTQRVVLESGYPEHPEFTEKAIIAFVHKHAHRFSSAYIVCYAGDAVDNIMGNHPIVFDDGAALLIRRLKLPDR